MNFKATENDLQDSTVPQRSSKREIYMCDAILTRRINFWIFGIVINYLNPLSDGVGAEGP